MAFYGLIPEMADRGVELRLIANHGKWNIAQEQWQWDYCGILVSGPMPKPGKSIDVLAHSRYGMLHPCALDGRT